MLMNVIKCKHDFVGHVFLISPKNKLDEKQQKD